jgi:hypothetical protein
MSQWISVKDRLPDVEQKVWACFKGQFEWVQYPAIMTAHLGIFANGYAAASHWMPLPNPPTEKPGD